MSFYDLDISKQAKILLPPDKRYNNTIAIIAALLSPLQWAHDLLFNSYYVGSSAPAYAPGTYNYQDEVIYNKQVYSSLIDNNTDAPTTSNWILIQNNFIGVQERALYNGNKLILEYACNKEFSTTFRQPNDPVNPTPSDIYITNIAATLTGFRIGSTELGSSSVGASGASASIGGLTPFVYVNNFTVNIPTALATALGANYVAIVSSFVGQYAAASINFTISTY